MATHWKIGKKPKHWPFVPPEQQKEGLKSIVKLASISDFEWALKRLTLYKFISKSKMSVLLKRYRKIANISYDDWRRGRKR